jgi:hypothetical protein
MSVLDPNRPSDAYQKSLEDRYWKMVKDTLRYVFKIEPPRWELGKPRELDLADKYRTVMSEAPFAEQILAYHLDPLDVAADLAGVEITDDHVIEYDRSVRNIVSLAGPR